MAETIAVIDIGSGNMRSVAKAFEHVAGRRGGAQIHVAETAEDIARADRIVLPGVGAFRACRAGVDARPGVLEALNEAVLDRGKPFLGICVGMQLMATRGLEFEKTAGFDWIAGEVRQLEPLPGRRIPHIGWNNVTATQSHPVLDNSSQGTDYYFVHSFHFVPENADAAIAICQYEGAITAAVARDNMIGVQFHPEKSQSAGLALLDRFLGWRP